MLFFCYLIVSLPINLLYECGFFISIYFRGSAGSTNVIMELLYDLIANMTMFARMQVQHVRVILGLAMYVELSTYVESMSIAFMFESSNTTNYAGFETNAANLESTFSFLLSQIMQVVIAVFELFHYIIFLIQSSASYAALIFWLFSLLYTSFVKDTTEMYFLLKSTIVETK